MTSSGGSSGGSSGSGSSDSSDRKNKTASQSRSTGEITYGTTDSPWNEMTKSSESTTLQKNFVGSNTEALNLGKGAEALDTTVTQAAAANAAVPDAAAPDAPAGTDTPRSDFSVILAGQTARRPDRSPSRSNNFVSMVGGAGGLGRRSDTAKRTLIGGA